MAANLRGRTAMASTNRKGTTATQRLKQDYMRLHQDPVPYIVAHPLPSNILEWHYIVRGPEGTPYEGGIYHGKLTFPSEFPFKPPAIYMLTPSGRFKCNTRLCLSISDYHPDTWNPAWSVSTILTGLLSFMVETKPTMGSIETSDYEKKVFAKQSWEYNMKNSIFVELFPDLVEEVKSRRLRSQQPDALNSVTGRVTELSQQIRSGIQHAGNRDNGALGSALGNLIVIIGFGAFVYTVRYVLQSID
ncbi:Ubiquitin-conjugating enzyme E2 J2 [Halotydeus destructor]|nr:Ubiquitin-conjugating enzyme E2 J2 [Halotydeus destructor]